MTHTYDDFTKKLASSGLQKQFSAEDLALAQRDPDRGMTILNAKIGWNNSKDPTQQAYYHSLSEQARKEGGNYSGGGDGADYLYLGSASAGAQQKLDELGNYGSFRYESPYAQQLDGALKGLQNTGSFQWSGTAPTYQNKYAGMQKDLLDQIVNRPEFSWSKDSDPSWSAYKKEYLREGDRAAANVLAQTSAASAGRPSSYAAAAASQAGDYYAGQLSDKIPELYQDAYQRYLDEHTMKRQDLGTVNTQEQMDYNKYLDQLGQYNTDRNFALSQWDANRGAAADYLDAVMGLDNQAYSQKLSNWQNNLELLGAQLGAYQGQEQTDYARRLEELDQALQKEQLDYNRKWNEDERDYTRQWNQAQQDYQRQQDAQKLLQGQVDAMLQAGADIPSDMAGSSGYDPRYTQALEQWYKQQAAAAAKSPGGSSGSRRRGSGGSGSSSASGSGAGLARAALEWASEYGGDPEDFVKANYKKYGYSSQTSALAALGMFQAEGGLGVSGDKYQAITRSLGEMLTNGRTANAIAYVDSLWGTLSSQQKKSLQSALGKYGLRYNP